LPGVSSVMGFGDLNVGHKLPLHKTLKKAVATAAIAGTLGLALFMSSVAPAVSGGETRTISMVHQHTGEKLTITYMQNGRYVPSAMKKLNYLLRDWRRNETVTIDPRTIDLIWELHADLGSRQPVHIVCGYRSPRTNAFLKRIGRKVAGKSQHMKGKAIDFFFPDVSTLKIRNSALARSVGGVGYYRSAGGPTGFLHADSGNVRHWGPAISRSQLASIIRDGRRSIGRHVGKKGVFEGAPDTQLASADTGSKKSRGLLGWFRGDKNEPVVDVVEPKAADAAPTGGIYDGGDEDELAALSDDAAATTAAEAKALAKAKKPTPVVEDVAPAFVEAQPEKVLPKALAKKDTGALAALAGTAAVEQQAEQRPVVAGMMGSIPKPRLKPKAVMTLASISQTDDTVVIKPVSAEPEQNWSTKSNRHPSPVADSFGTVEDAKTIAEDDMAPTSAADGKSNLDTDIRTASADPFVKIEPVVATQTEPSWVTALFSSAEASLRRDGVKTPDSAVTSMPVAAVLGPDGSGEIEISAPVSAEGKGDALFVNREGKSSLPALKLRLSSRQ
jgi:uncharacterized protein YcbK (DUF882 family)